MPAVITHAPLKVFLSGACLALLAACSTTGSSTQAGGALDTSKSEYLGAVGAYSNPNSNSEGRDPIANAAFWGTRYNTNQNDADIAVKFQRHCARLVRKRKRCRL